MASKIGICVQLLLIKRRSGFSGEDTYAECNLTTFVILLGIVTHLCTNILLILGSITVHTVIRFTITLIKVTH